MPSVVRTSPLALVPALVLAAACTATPEAPTWYRDVQPVLAQQCVGCHTATGIGPFPLTTYEEAKPFAAAIATAVAAGTMPPWLIAPGLPFKHERRLTDAQVDTLKKWADAEAPLGDPKTAPEELPPPLAATIRADKRIEMASAYSPDRTETDDYRCFVLDPGLTTRQAITGFDIKPGNTKIVHHVILFAVAPDDQGRMERLDADEAGEGYTCFGDARVDAQFVGAWVPGTTATAFPSHTGIKVDAGTKIVMQVHYNTLEDRDGTDQTTAELELAAPDNVTGAIIFPILDNDFRIAPGVIDGVKTTFDTTYFDMPRDLVINMWGVAPHMHLHGKSIKFTLERADGELVTLFDVPRWDFHWQQLYFYEEPVELRYGDKVHLECVWDNRAEAQPIVNGQRTEAKELTWGENTLEEMCLNFVYATY